MEEQSFERMWPPELPYDHNGMDLEKALIMTEAAKKKSEQLGYAMTVAVCDSSGTLVSLQRMNDSPLLSLEIAQNKAKTAVFGKIPTMLWGGFFKGPEPELSSLYFHSNWVTFMGGFPVILDGKIIGGFGCSGATWEDGVVSRAALESLGADISGTEACLKEFGIPEGLWK